jgi:hypothetical protein
MFISIPNKALSLLLLGSALFTVGSLTACLSDSTSASDPQAGKGSALESGPWAHPADSLDEAELPNLEQVGPILKDRGYSRFEFEGKSVVVEGDMVFHRADFIPFLSPRSQGLGKSSQRAFSLGLSNRVNRSVTWKVYIDPRLPPFWKFAAIHGLNEWMKAAQFKFTVSTNANNPADIRISFSKNLPHDVIARSNEPRVIAPSLVAPGNSIMINLPDFGNASTDVTYFTMMHELGHCFGFEHTDGPYGVHIPGTPEQDKNSIMTARRHKYHGFTSGDMQAIHYLYPPNVRTARDGKIK